MGAIVLNWFILNIYSFTCSLMFWVHISKLRDGDHRIIFSGHSALPSVKKRNSPTKQHLLYWATYVFGCWTPATHQPITQGIYGAVAYCRKKRRNRIDASLLKIPSRNGGGNISRAIFCSRLCIVAHSLIFIRTMIVFELLCIFKTKMIKLSNV